MICYNTYILNKQENYMLSLKTQSAAPLFTKEDIPRIVNEAFAAAKTAEAAYRAKHGEPMYCGFAWCNVGPGNSAVAKYLKANNLARPSYSKGVDVWNPGGSHTQSMDIKEEGAYAFAKVLQSYGIKAYASSRAD
jgi:hypothetical protein